MTKKEKLINFIEHQASIKLENNKDNLLNKKRNILYTEISRNNKNTVLRLLNLKQIRYEEHLNNSYFIYL